MEKGQEGKGFHFTFDNYYSNLYTIAHSVKNNIFFIYTFSKNKYKIIYYKKYCSSNINNKR